MDAPPAKKAKEGDNRGPTVIRLRVENPEKIDCVDSPGVIVRGFPLTFRVYRVPVSNGTDSFRVLAVSDVDTYYCDYTMKVKMINQVDASATIESSITGRFDSSGSARRPSISFPWRNFIDQDKGFLKDGAVIFEASITVTNSDMRKKNLIDFMSPSNLFDVTFIIDEKKVYASRKFLASQSDVFMGMFSNGFKESDESTEISIPDVKLKDFVNVLNILYRTGSELVDETNFEGLLAVAEKYNITPIFDAVEKHLLEDNTVALSRRLRISDGYRLNLLRERLLSSLDTNGKIRELKKSADFAYLSPEMKDFLFDKSLRLAEMELIKHKDEYDAMRIDYKKLRAKNAALELQCDELKCKHSLKNL